MSLNISPVLQKLIERTDLSRDEMTAAFSALMKGELTPAQVAGFAVALRCKGETVDEVAAAARVMRSLVAPVTLQSALADELVDLCGTGGDGAHTFNISTTAMFVAAGAGARVAKHGGRSVSSSCGSADVLEAAGANIQLNPEQVAECVSRCSVGFMFAPNHHGAMKHAAPVRRELGVRTLFNVLGPLTNPAGARRQLMGVFKPELTTLQARVLQQLGSTHVMVVHGHNGLDEIALSGETRVAELKAGQVQEYAIAPEQFGLSRQSHDSLVARSAAESLAILQGVLRDEPGPARDIVLLNATAAIYVSGLTASLQEGFEAAQNSLSSGRAQSAFDQFVSTTRLLANAV